MLLYKWIMKKVKQWFVPEDSAEWVISIGALIFLAAYVTERMVIISPEWQQLLPPSFKWLYLQNIEIAGLALVISALIISGAGKLRHAEPKPDSLIKLALGLLIGIELIGMDVSAYRELPKLTGSLFMSEEMLAKFQARLGKTNIDAHTRAYIGKSIARENYLKTGECSTYLDERGNLQNYVPNERDVKVKKRADFTARIIPTFKTLAYIWTSIIIGSLILGVAIPLRTGTGARTAPGKTQV